MNEVRVGVIGLGGMGSIHTKTMKEIGTCKITAVCDIVEDKIAKLKEEASLGPEVAGFTDYRELLSSGLCDCIAVVTPHPSHLEISAAAFESGHHVMCDKPITISVSEADQLLSFWRNSGKLFSTMYSMRTTSCNKVIREWIKSNKLGEIRRVEMTCTQWLRTQIYYDEQAWRGTWNGEGSGLLLNQAPHNLDMLFWWFGEADEIQASVANRMHNIETDDEVDSTIFMKDGFPIRFYATTGEAPGKDYVEIVGDNGTLIRENNELRFRKLKSPLGDTIQNSKEMFAVIESEDIQVEIPEVDRGHKVVFANFFDAILGKIPEEELVSPGGDGIQAVEWANAMLLSSYLGERVKLPIDRQEYETLLSNLQSGETTIKDFKNTLNF